MDRKLQIGVMGSMANILGPDAERLLKMAEDTGYYIAEAGCTLLFGAEKDGDSLSSAACRGAKRAGGLVIGVTYNKGLQVFEPNADVIIASGMERGGGRELCLVLSCDAIIAINGGSGTLTEVAIAYQANIPIVAIKGSGGWADELCGRYLDARKRVLIEAAASPVDAVAKAVNLARNR